MLKKVESLIITSDTYDEAVSFFKESLGLAMPAHTRNLAQFGINGLPIFVARCNKGSGHYISIESDDIDTDYREMQKRGIKFLDPILELQNGDMATFFKGPADIDFMLYQPAKGKGNRGDKNST